jgi:hypothetical protein
MVERHLKEGRKRGKREELKVWASQEHLVSVRVVKHIEWVEEEYGETKGNYWIDNVKLTLGHRGLEREGIRELEVCIK